MIVAREEIDETLVKITLSDGEGAEYQKIVIRPVQGKTLFYQAEQYRNKQVFHCNLSLEELFRYLEEREKAYRQILVTKAGKTVSYARNASGSYKRRESENDVLPSKKTHNREKNYLLPEGEKIPALVDLGVFTKDYQIVKAKYDKFKQINRFVELVDDAFRDTQKTSLTILDFGCGKSYLTFILYYYFTVKRGIAVKVIGYDLKADVVKHCNEVAKRYGYQNLQFVVADVTKDVLFDEPIDMVVTLHACDTATDYAFAYAVRHGAKDIFSVPCCQHEVNLSIHGGGDLDPLLKYGIVKERVCALLTDTVRALLLEDEGYAVDLVEFVDFEHSPKNVMIRAGRGKVPSTRNRKIVEELMKKYGFEQTLYRLLTE